MDTRKNDKKIADPKKTREEPVELQVEELEERIAPITVFNKGK